MTSEGIENLLGAYIIMRDRVNELEKQVEVARWEGFEAGYLEAREYQHHGPPPAGALKAIYDDYAKSREGK